MANKFKIGDKVRILKTRHKSNSHYRKTENHTGTVTFIPNGNYPEYAVDVDDVKNPLSSFGCFYYNESELEAVKQKQPKFKIVITTDGRVTKAAMYEGKQKIKVATSTCHPNDEFDFSKGAAIALERLTGQKYDKHTNKPKEKSEEKPKSKYFTGKIRCVRVDERNAGWLTKDKIYIFVNGCSVDDVGLRLPLAGPIDSVEDLNKRLCSDFEELQCFDWDSFKAGKFNVIVNRENVGRFLEACEAHDVNWPRNKATEWNPIKKMDTEPDFVMLMLKAALGFESTDKCDFKVEDGNLRYSFSPHIRRETIIYD